MMNAPVISQLLADNGNRFLCQVFYFYPGKYKKPVIVNNEIQSLLTSFIIPANPKVSVRPFF